MQIDGQAIAQLIAVQYFSQSRGIGGIRRRMCSSGSYLGCEQATTNQQDSRVLGVLRGTRVIGHRKMLRQKKQDFRKNVKM
jgi:hypothetical protein